MIRKQTTIEQKLQNKIANEMATEAKKRMFEAMLDETTKRKRQEREASALTPVSLQNENVSSHNNPEGVT